MDQWWSWILTIVGLTGFVLAGKKVWWCWYINIAAQVLWFTYAIVTEQYGFIVASLAYAYVFTKNAVMWTREHLAEVREPEYEVELSPWCWGQKTLRHPKCENNPPHEPHYMGKRRKE